MAVRRKIRKLLVPGDVVSNTVATALCWGLLGIAAGAAGYAWLAGVVCK